MNAQGLLLAQITPTDTSDTLAFTALAPITEVTKIFVTNTSGGALSFRIFHDDDGSAYATTNALYYNATIGANSTVVIEGASGNAGILLQSGGTLGVRSSAANDITFSIYGVTGQAAQRLIGGSYG